MVAIGYAVFDAGRRLPCMSLGLLVATALGGCTVTRNGDGDDLAMSGSSLGSAASESEDEGEGEGGGDATGGLRLDVAGGEGTKGGAEGGNKEGCGKIDFLFVVDSSGSMGGKQANLVASFPGFISTIQDVMQIDDYHIMVVDTDDTTGNQYCETLCGIGFLPDCDGVPCDQIPPATACDSALGGGKLKDLNGMQCPVQGDRRFLVQGQPNLGQTFECLARVGINGSGDERPMGAMVSALSPAQLGPGGCNEGFLRDDAILVVTVITDEEDDPNDVPGDGCSAIDNDANSQGNPTSWRDAIIAAKHGDEQAVVFLSLLGDCDVGNGVCGPLVQVNNVWSGGEPSPRLRTLAESFTYGTWGSVCAPDYNPFFQEAVSVIDTACDGFNPPA
jgi:hypothetical protein